MYTDPTGHKALSNDDTDSWVYTTKSGAQFGHITSTTKSGNTTTKTTTSMTPTITTTTKSAATTNTKNNTVTTTTTTSKTTKTGSKTTTTTTTTTVTKPVVTPAPVQQKSTTVVSSSVTSDLLQGSKNYFVGVAQLASDASYDPFGTYLSTVGNYVKYNVGPQSLYFKGKAFYDNFINTDSQTRTENIGEAITQKGVDVLLTGIGLKTAKAASPKISAETVSSIPKTNFYVTPKGDAIPSTGYRYISEKAPYLDELSNTKVIPCNSNGTYFSFDKYDIASPGKLQVPHDASIRGTFNTLQIIDDIRVPNGNWGKANYLEPLTMDFPEFGRGGATQAVTNKSIILNDLTKLPKK